MVKPGKYDGTYIRTMTKKKMEGVVLAGCIPI